MSELKEKEYFRGDTFEFPFTFFDENKKPLSFKKGDILRVGFKKNIYSENLLLNKELVVDEEITSWYVKYLPSETRTLELTKYLVEIEHNRGEDSWTIYQKEIEVKGAVME